MFEFRFMFHWSLFPRIHWIDSMSPLVQIIRYPNRRQAIIWTLGFSCYAVLSRNANEHIQTEAMRVTKCIGLCHQDVLRITTGLHFRGVSNLSGNRFIGKANVWFGYITQGTNAIYLAFAKHEVPRYRGGSKTIYRVYVMNYRHDVLCFALLSLRGSFYSHILAALPSILGRARVITPIYDSTETLLQYWNRNGNLNKLSSLAAPEVIILTTT